MAGRRDGIGDSLNGAIYPVRTRTGGHACAFTSNTRGCDYECYYGGGMKRRPTATTLRRSVALPSALIGELNSVAPPELRTNLNRLVIVSLQEYVARRRREEFDRAIAAMAGDPQVRAECAAIARDFAATEADGLRND